MIAKIDEPVISEKERSDHRDFRQLPKLMLPKTCFVFCPHGDVSAGFIAEDFTEELPEASAEDGERQTRDVLIWHVM